MLSSVASWLLSRIFISERRLLCGCSYVRSPAAEDLSATGEKIDAVPDIAVLLCIPASLTCHFTAISAARLYDRLHLHSLLCQQLTNAVYSIQMNLSVFFVAACCRS